MNRLNEIITSLQTQQVDVNQALAEVKSLLKEEKLQEADLMEGLYQLRARNVISDGLYDLVFSSLESNAPQDILTDDKTRFKTVTTADKTLAVDDNTVLHSTGDDKTVVRTATQDETVIAVHHSEINSAETVLSDHDHNNANLDTTAETVFADDNDIENATQSFNFSPSGTRKKPLILKPGSIIKDRFILKRKIGSGGMSVVYKALDLRKQEAKNAHPYVAIKLLGDVFKHHPQSFLTLERESQKIQNLAHPNIITVYDFDRDQDTIYMTMECLDGESLDETILKNKVGLPLHEALPVIDGMCKALQYAHSKDIIHSDFKPENVYLTDDNFVKVLDFGIARAKQLPESDEFDVGSLGALTPNYASCEMFERKEPDPSDDIYALGCITYKLLTGVHPFGEKSAIDARDEGLKPKKINTLNRRQWQTLEDSLAFNREDRIATVEVFYTGIAPKTRSPLLIASTTAMILALALSAYFWTIYKQKPVIPLKKLTTEQIQQIDDYMEVADLYFTMGYLASPPGDSAFDQYEKILAINPAHQKAIAGKKRIVHEYRKLATEKAEAGEKNEALQMIKMGLFVDPENETLLSLKKEMTK